jgi:deoxyribose-phosphate aldolase
MSLELFTVGGIAASIDHSLLSPEATEKEIMQLCAEAIVHGFGTVCVNPCNVALCRDVLGGYKVGIASVIGFPLGANTSRIKVAEVEEVISLGATKLDVVINFGRLIGEDTRYVLAENKEIVKAACGRPVRFIIEAAALLALREELLEWAVKLCVESGATTVKTSTGFHAKGGATPEMVSAIKRHAGIANLDIKAAGGIKTFPQLLALKGAGARWFGASKSMAILAEAKAALAAANAQ